jgi:hypothetical protein
MPAEKIIIVHVMTTAAEQPIGRVSKALASLVQVIHGAAEIARKEQHRERQTLIVAAGRYDIGGDE